MITAPRNKSSLKKNYWLDTSWAFDQQCSKFSLPFPRVTQIPEEAPRKFPCGEVNGGILEKDDF